MLHLLLRNVSLYHKEKACFKMYFFLYENSLTAFLFSMCLLVPHVLLQWMSWCLKCLSWRAHSGNYFSIKTSLTNSVIIKVFSPLTLGFPGSLAGKESACNVGDLGSIPGLGRAPGEGNSCPRQHSGLESPTGCVAPGLAQSQTRLSCLHFRIDG